MKGGKKESRKSFNPFGPGVYASDFTYSVMVIHMMLYIYSSSIVNYKYIKFINFCWIVAP